MSAAAGLLSASFARLALREFPTASLEVVYTTPFLFRTEAFSASMVGTEQVHVTVDTVFDILAHDRRRHALRCLLEYETPIPLADLADEVAVRENDAPLAEIPPENVKRVYMSLYHMHIPRLADAKYVRYDQERDAVTLRDHAEQFEQLRAHLETESAVTNR